MQLICETYHLMKEVLRFGPDEMKTVFRNWNEGDLRSCLIEITGDILSVKDEDGELILDKILDAGGQKGTGKWTVTSALDLGTPLTLIGESVFARYLSSAKEKRTKASRLLAGPPISFDGEKGAFVEELERALYASKIVSYAQGFALLKAASEKYGGPSNRTRSR